MRQQTYDIVVTQAVTHDPSLLEEFRAKELAQAATSIGKVADKLGVAHHNIAFVYIPATSQDQSSVQTARKLSELVGSRSVRNWNRWEGLSAFGTRVVNGCLQGQLLVLVGSQDVVKAALRETGVSDVSSARPSPTLFTARLRVKHRMLRKPAHDFRLIQVL